MRSLLAVTLASLATGAVADAPLEALAGADCTIHSSDDAGVIAVDAALKARGSSLALTLEDGGAQSEGDWIVLGPTLCTIRIPRSATKLRLSDPDVRPFFGPYTAEPEFNEYGCFVDRFAMQDAVAATRGWSDERAYDEVGRLLAKGLINGDVAFYSDNNLATPRSYQLMTGDCGDVPAAAKIDQSHAMLAPQFGAVIRGLGAVTDCTDPRSGASPIDVARDVHGDDQTNAWFGIYHLVITLAAGWHEGATQDERGTPRPPLCHYP